jgi:hypothetical protein
MTFFFSRSAYGINPNAGRNRNNAAERGWGPGWPNCQTSKMVKVTRGDHSVFVRREIAQLVATLFALTEKRGYDINPAGEVNQTWGFACRPIRGSDTPSNHSWGLAIDINSLSNPMQSTFKSNIPPNVVHDWEICGFYWGGRYLNRPDAMHFEHIGRPEDIAADLARAVSLLKGVSLPTPPVKPGNPNANTVLDGDAIRAAARGADQQGDHFDDARQFMAIVRAWQEKYRPYDPAKLRNTESAWLETWSTNTPDRSRRAALFVFAIKFLQAGFSLSQDGYFGPKTAAVLEGLGYTVNNKS